MSATATAAETCEAPTVTMISVRLIRPTPENSSIYRPENVTGATFVDLCNSIRGTGINTPLEISWDHYIISGHRRFAAATHCGLDEIPCIIDENVVMRDLSGPERVTLLIERNKGIRIKSDGELYLEAAASVDPEAAVREAQERKAQVFDKTKKSALTEVEIVGCISRTDPRGERTEFLQAVLEILAEKREGDYLPTNGRSIHYKLLGRNVRTSTRRNGYTYGKAPVRYDKQGNKKKDGSAGLLSKLLTDARSAGLIDHADLDDGTRPTHTFVPDGTVGQYINTELQKLFGCYYSDVHSDQPHHVEILVEKNTVFPLLTKHVAQVFRLPITSLRGYGSFPAARDVAQRFEDSGKDKLVVIYVSDLDPEGINKLCATVAECGRASSRARVHGPVLRTAPGDLLELPLG